MDTSKTLDGIQKTWVAPAFDSALPTLPSPRHPLSVQFHAILAELGALHDKKQSDYGRPNDPFANVRASNDFGIPPWVGAMVRANDKMRRIQKFAQTNSLMNESVIDSLNDMAVYCVIARLLYEEGNA